MQTSHIKKVAKSIKIWSQVKWCIKYRETVDVANGRKDNVCMIRMKNV